MRPFPQNSPGNLSMNNQPGTPREDGEMGGNFLNPFQSESVSQTVRFPALLTVEAFVVESVLTARPFLRVSAVFSKHDHERLKAPAARWRSRSLKRAGRFSRKRRRTGCDVTYSSDSPPTSTACRVGTFAPTSLYYCAPIPNPAHPNPPPPS